MKEPSTPTGKRLARSIRDAGVWVRGGPDDILAIEREAAAPYEHILRYKAWQWEGPEAGDALIDGWLLEQTLRQRADALADQLAEALRALTCDGNGEPNALRPDFPDGGDIVLRWPGNKADWEAAHAALAAYEEARK